MCAAGRDEMRTSRGRRLVAQRRVRPDLVVVSSPAFDDDSRFFQRGEDLAVEQLVAKLRVEAFAIAIFPWASGFDVSRPGSRRGNPILHGGRYKFGSIAPTEGMREAAETAVRAAISCRRAPPV